MIAKKNIFIALLLVINITTAQNIEPVSQTSNTLFSIKTSEGVTITFDEPAAIDSKKPTELILYALPNGNTTAQTFGKITKENEDWHFNIQHIGAQTKFIRKTDTAKNYIVVYLENELKSWPAWRKKYANSNVLINDIVALVKDRYKKQKPKMMLSCHSGGGSFIFGFLNANKKIPKNIDRIGFLDATYGYETDLHLTKISQWLKNKKHRLEIIAYNDSVVVYNGKPLVSPTGGTWYRSKLMASDLEKLFKAEKREDDEKFTLETLNSEFLLVKNPQAKIYHTVLVEKNGFIHLVFKGTPYENKGYQFWSNRAYQNEILDSL